MVVELIFGIKGDSNDGQPRQQDVDPKMLRPTEPAENTPAAAGDPPEKMQQDSSYVQSKNGQQNRRSIKPFLSRPVKHQGKGDREFGSGHQIGQRRGQRMREWLIVERLSEMPEGKDFGKAGIYKQQYQQPRDRPDG